MRHISRAVVAASLLASFGTAQRVAEGGQCSQANNRLDGATGNFVTDCDHQTFCDETGICRNKTCRQDEYPLGYNEVAYADLPPLCPQGEFCPDEGSGCMTQVGTGQGCQLDRDNQCSPPPAELRLAGELNTNGSICLNFVCYWSNVTLGQDCIFENKAYSAFDNDGGSFGYVFSRDNCANGLYCDGTTMKCNHDKKIGEACTGNKECQSYWCVDNKCHKAAGDPRRPGVWVYPVVAICIALLMVGIGVGLWLWHKKNREKNRIKLEQYESEQTAYRQALLSLSNARESIMALPKDTPEFVARQSLYSLDGYRDANRGGYASSIVTGESPPGSRRPSSFGYEDRGNEDDVLIIPSSKARG